jgi:hypothetical protein
MVPKGDSMPTTTKKKSKPVNDPPVATEKRPASLWSLHGMEDVYFQREAQVNFWTVMGGLEAAALVTQLDSLLAQMQAGRWHLVLFFIDSILIIVLGWALLAWGSLVLKYPITVLNTLLIFTANFAVVIQCIQVTNPAGWLAATAAAGLLQWIHQIHFSRSGAWVPFSAEAIRQLKINLRIYVFWPLICFAGALHLYLAPSNIAEMIWGVVVLVIVIDALFRRHRDMEKERKELGIP